MPARVAPSARCHDVRGGVEATIAPGGQVLSGREELLGGARLDPVPSSEIRVGFLCLFPHGGAAIETTALLPFDGMKAKLANF